MNKDLQKLLDKKFTTYNQTNFIPNDPISIPHRFSKRQDIEIAGFFAAIFAWGNRKSIINSCNKLLALMQNKPYEFIMQRNFDNKLDHMLGYENFVHRTFNEMDLYHLLMFLRYHYWFMEEESLETAFFKTPIEENEIIRLKDNKPQIVEACLINFYNYVFGYDEDAKEEIHCRKHIATPAKKSACKRLNMYLRWMVRTDNNGVDFGLWKSIKPSQLICPLDVHVGNVARQLGLLHRKQNDWQAAIELTDNLKIFDPNDPVKYDFALFGIGVNAK